MSPELEEVLVTLGHLVAAQIDEGQEIDDDESLHNFQCERCVRCRQCRFCTACEDCSDCTHCDACSLCEACTQSRACHSCARCSHSVHCAYCEGSSYLLLCYDCEASVHCFACVGLSGEEFCVLNERLSRRDYFAKVSRLRAELDAQALAGWVAPWQDPAPASPPTAVPAISGPSFGRIEEPPMLDAARGGSLRVARRPMRRLR